MESKSSSPVELFFFPFVGGGHQIPMIDIARLFASHGAQSTIIATPKHALSFQNSIHRDQKSGRPISVLTLHLPDGIDLPYTDMSAPGRTDTSILREPLKALLLSHRPDCIVHDVFHRWSAEVIDGFGIPRIGFSGSGCFSRCVQENMGKFKPHEKVGSDYEPFVVPGLPDPIQMTRSQIPIFIRQNPPSGFHKKMPRFDEDTAFGNVVNSFYELEPAYVEYCRRELGFKIWLVGPVSLCNRGVEDKAERGQKTSIDEQAILNWLDCKEPNSVIYVSFGSAARLAPEQLPEIATGLEASDQPFIWVVGQMVESAEKVEESKGKFLLDGFEERVTKSGKGLIIRGWAPQLLILEHKAVGGFMTHCGWNSTLEGVSAGVPMATWPMGAEQFSNEKLITDVLGIGVKVGSLDWGSGNSAVGREKVEAAVRRLMGGNEEAEERRRRARELGEQAKRAVEEGGSSYMDAEALIQELKYCREN